MHPEGRCSLVVDHGIFIVGIFCVHPQYTECIHFQEANLEAVFVPFLVTYDFEMHFWNVKASKPFLLFTLTFYQSLSVFITIDLREIIPTLSVYPSGATVGTRRITGLQAPLLIYPDFMAIFISMVFFRGE